MKFKGAALIPLAFMLAGCFDMQQSMSINEDGTTTLDIDLSVMKSALSFAEQTPEGFCSGLTSQKALSGISMKNDMQVNDNTVTCKWHIEGNTDQLIAAMNSKPFTPEEGGMLPHLTKEGDNIVAQVWVSMKGNNKANTSDSDMDRMLSKSLNGHTLKWKISGPKIISSSGPISDDQKTTTFAVPLSDVMGGKRVEYVFSAIIEDKRSIFAKIRSWFS